MRKSIALVLAVVTLVSLLGTTALAAGSKGNLVEFNAPKGVKIVDTTRPVVTMADINEAVRNLTDEQIKAFEDLGFDAPEARYAILREAEVTIEDGKSAELEISLDGVTDTDLGVAAWYMTTDGTLAFLNVGMAVDVLPVTLNENGTLCVTSVK